MAEYGWPIGMPVCENLGSELYEVRISLKGNRIARVFFSPQEGRMVLLHGFIKKSTSGRKTPPNEIEVGRSRLADLKRRMAEAERATRRRAG